MYLIIYSVTQCHLRNSAEYHNIVARSHLFIYLFYSCLFSTVDMLSVSVNRVAKLEDMKTNSWIVIYTRIT